MFTLYIGQDLLDLLTLYLTVNIQEKKNEKNYKEGSIWQSYSSPLSTLDHTVRVRKSENFPDSKIFVAKTFLIKRVNRVNF